MAQQIISLSGGKDSTALLFGMIERGEDIHSAVFFDTGWEFPHMYAHLTQLEKMSGVKIVRLAYHRSFDELLMRYGWPSISGWWCKAAKRDTINKYARKVAKETEDEVIQCIGMAADEPKRQKQNGPFKKRYPLNEWGMVESEALEVCQAQGFAWGGLYDVFHRVSCRLCPERGLSGSRLIRRHYPEVWGEIRLKGRCIPGNQKYIHNQTADELDARFEYEESMMEHCHVA